MGLGKLVRGTGRLLRGKGKEALRDFRDTAGDMGDLSARAAPIAALVPGIGPVVAAGMGAVGGVMGELNDEDGFNFGQGLKTGALSAVGSLGVGKLGSMVKGAGGLQGVMRAAPVSKLLGGGGAGGMSLPGGAAAGAGGGGGGFSLGGLARGALGFAKDNPELVMAGAGMVQNARRQAGADGLRAEALDGVRARANEMAPLRAAAVQRLLAMPQIDPSQFLPSGGAYDRR